MSGAEVSMPSPIQPAIQERTRAVLGPGALTTPQVALCGAVRVKASLSPQEEDILYYDAKADAELVSPLPLLGGRGAARAHPPPRASRLSCKMSVRSRGSPKF